MKRFLYFAIVILIVFSCNISEKKLSITPGETISVKLVNNTIHFSSLFDNCKVIYIGNILIGNIKKLYVQQDKMIFLTASGKKRVHIYDTVTKNITSIAEKGRGPKQIASFRDFYVINDSIYILDFIKKRLKIFSLSGNLIEDILIPDYCDGFYPLKKNQFILYKKVPYQDYEEFKINILQKNGQSFETKNQFIPVKEFEAERDFRQLTTFYKLNDTSCYTHAFSNTIYNVYPNKIIPRYILDFNNKLIPKDIYNDEHLNLREFGLKCKFSDFVWNINCVLESNSKLSFTFWYKEKVYLNVYDKNSQEISTFNLFHDDIFSSFRNCEISEQFKPIYITDDAFYFLVEPFYLLDRLRDIKENNPDHWLTIQNTTFYKNIINKLQPTGNPLIIKYYFL